MNCVYQYLKLKSLIEDEIKDAEAKYWKMIDDKINFFDESFL